MGACCGTSKSPNQQPVQNPPPQQLEEPAKEEPKVEDAAPAPQIVSEPIPQQQPDLSVPPPPLVVEESDEKNRQIRECLN